MVPPLDAQVRRHVSRFDVIALVLYRDGRIGTSRDPQNAEFAFWLEAQHAGAVLRLARVKGDIPAAAQRLGLKVTDHHTMIVRARCGRAARPRSCPSKGRWRVAVFNAEYQRRRLAAREAGQGFVSYPAAQSGLRKALVGIAAGDRPGIVARVFGPQ